MKLVDVYIPSGLWGKVKLVEYLPQPEVMETREALQSCIASQLPAGVTWYAKVKYPVIYVEELEQFRLTVEVEVPVELSDLQKFRW